MHAGTAFEALLFHFPLSKSRFAFYELARSLLIRNNNFPAFFPMNLSTLSVRSIGEQLLMYTFYIYF
jgi:hypothetical protein